MLPARAVGHKAQDAAIRSNSRRLRWSAMFAAEFDPTTIALGFLFGGIGFVAFRYGRARQQVPPLVLGMALMGVPMFVTSAIWLSVVGVGLTAGLWLWRE